MLSPTSIVAFASVFVGFFMGVFWINGTQNLEIARLNNQIKNLETTLEKSETSVQSHKQFIRKKDQMVNKFCKEYGAK